MTRIRILAIIGLVAFSLGCGGRFSTEELQTQVKQSMEEEYAKDPQTKHIKVKSLLLTHKGGNEYTGVAQLEGGGEKANLTVNVTYDGNSFMWKAVDE